MDRDDRKKNQIEQGHATTFLQQAKNFIGQLCEIPCYSYYFINPNCCDYQNPEIDCAAIDLNCDGVPDVNCDCNN